MIEWDHLVALAQIVIVPVASWIIRQLNLILGQLRMLNGRVGKMESWQIGHEIIDRERFEAIQRELDIQGDRCIEHLRKTGGGS